MPFLIDRSVLERVRRLEIPWSRHGIDPYGATQTDLARMYTILGWLHHHYFRVITTNIHHIPGRGRAMLVGNHSGGWAVDALMVLASVFYRCEPPRLAHGMAEKFINQLPFASTLSARTGQLTGLPEHATRLLEDERVLMVFPEGARGTAKLYPERNSLVRFGTGFLRLATQTRTPIVPFAVIGGGDAIPSFTNLYALGKLMGVPYIPITPYLLPIPLPVQMRIEYGEPILFEGNGNEPDDVVSDRVHQVVERIAALIHKGVAEGRPRLFGRREKGAS